jgi:hypothetical protein
MPATAWEALPERLAVVVPPGQVLDQPSPAELDAALNDFQTRAGFGLPASYQEFLHRFGPGELSGYFRISSPIPPRLRGGVAEAFDIDALREMLDDPEGYWATEVAPTLRRRLVLFAETIGGDWLFWDLGDVRDPARSEYGVYGFTRGDRHRGKLLAGSFAEFITDVCLGRGFPATKDTWEPEWAFVPGWPTRNASGEQSAPEDGPSTSL